MGKTNQNFTFFKGDDLVQSWLHVGPFWQTEREVLSLDAADEINFKMYPMGNPGSPNITYTRAAGDIDVVTSGHHLDNDKIRVHFKGTDSSSLTADDYGYQLEAVYGGTESVVIASGTATLKERA